MNITDADYAHMPWHARQKLNDRLAAETRALKSELTQLRLDQPTAIAAAVAELDSAVTEAIDARARQQSQQVILDATALLATLDPDPMAASHRDALSKEINPYRKAVAA